MAERLLWGDSGEPPPSSLAINTVQRLAEASIQHFGATIGANAESWAIAQLDNGGPLAEWRGPGGDLELHIGPDGAIGYLFVTEQDNARHYEEGDAISVSTTIQLMDRVWLGDAIRG